MIMITPEQFKKACGTLLGIVNKQSAISAQSNLGDKTAMASLTEAGQQLNEDTLRVLVMGKFSSGKSTFLNALMGQKLLPAKPTPTTAVIGEIVYSDVPNATLYPKKGYAGGDKPFSIGIDELSNYIVIDHTIPQKDERKAENPFSKIVIKYPLQICKHGIMFVDSPGLDDPTCHDAITKDYLPTADAILYCMNSSQAFSAADKFEIGRLRDLGYKSIIFVLTYYDVLLYNDEMNGTNDAEETKRHYIKQLSEYTDLGENGIFFVGSLPALNAKLTNKPEQLQKSNFPPLEKRLEEILFNEKGRMKLLKALYSTRRVNRTTSQQLTDLIEVANSSRTGLSERIHGAEAKLNQAQARANEILSQFRYSGTLIINGAKDRGRHFFLSEILPNLSTWSSDFTPSDDQSISMWHPKRTGAAFTEGCIKYVQACIESEMAKWCDTELVNGYIVPQLKTLIQQQDANLESFEEDLKNVRATLNLSINSEAINEEENVGTANRIVSAIAAAFLLNPACLVTGAALGWKGLVASLVAALVGGIVIGIISIFTPVGLPAFIITWILSTIAGGTYVSVNIEEKIKNRIAEKMKEELSKQQETVAANIGTTVSEVLDKVQAAVEDSLNAPVEQYRKLLAEAQRSVNAEGSEIQHRISTYSQLRSENTSLANDMDTFAQCLNA
jgi:GTPase SAR1 family protein